jgi:dihydrofolate reductase
MIMRKVVLFMHLSLDGFAAGPNGELNWVPYDDETQDYADGIVSTVGAAIYGRVTYGMMEGYWPTVPNNPSSSQREKDHANWYMNIEKIVLSKNLMQVNSNNTKLIKENIVEEIGKLKEQSGKDLVIFGSPSVAKTFIQLGLIDEFQLTVSPVILGRGVRLFEDLQKQMNLELLSCRALKSGIITLHYLTKK